MYGTQNFTVIYIVADVHPVYVEMLCEIKNQETLETKLVCLCGGLRENGVRLDTWRSFVAPCLKSAR